MPILVDAAQDGAFDAQRPNLIFLPIQTAILDPILWSDLEMSVGVTSASMGSVLPLWKALIGKKAPTSGSSGDGFVQLARSKQSSGTVDTEDGVGLPEL